MESNMVRIFSKKYWGVSLAALCLMIGSVPMSAPASAQVNQSNRAFTAVSAPATNPTPSPAHAFDVATIKPIPSDGRPTQGWVGVQYHPDGMEAASLNLPELLCDAYGYKSIRFDGQVTGLPDWAVNQKYDIVAKMSAKDISTFQNLSNAEQEQWREAMLQSLLADRFS